MKTLSQLSRLVMALTMCLPFLYNPTATADAPQKRASAVSLPRKTPLYSNWRLVAQSDMIVQGRLRVPVAVLRASIKAKKRESVAVHLAVKRILKGEPKVVALTIRFYPTSSYDVPASRVLALQGKEVTACLAQAEINPDPSTLYFTGYTPDALAPSSRWLTERIEKEITNQKHIATYYARPSTFVSIPMDNKVKKLIAGMTNEKTQFQSFADLEALGEDAVPSTIRWMDNRRRLAIPEIALRNKSPQAFEATRHYSPIFVVDALDAILNQVTGESFGSLDVFASDNQRKQTVNAWRTYLYYGRPKNNG